ncbi:MAG: glucoamylase family protein [Candidatus Ancaeobacter aquaticus]|nr:glucoamylase family protein [Candidatus Ancaeobacter aquaticus]
MKKVLRQSFFSICIIVLVMLCQKHALSETLCVDNFNSRGGPNKVGGASDTWCKSVSKILSGYKKNETKIVLFEKPLSGYALKLKYDVDSKGGEAGWWTALNKADYSAYDTFSFWVRGDFGGEKCTIGIKDVLWFETKLPIDRYLESGITGEWQKVVIPLSDFSDIHDWHSLDNISITFDYGKDSSNYGTIYFDNFELVRQGEGILNGIAPQVVIEQPNVENMTNDEFMDFVQKKAFLFFWKGANPKNGLIKDISHAFKDDNYHVCSIASVGFGLAAICVAEERGWISHFSAYSRVLTTLKYFYNDVCDVHGFYYHYLDMKTGQRKNMCEVSSIDTALFIAGALVAGQYYMGTEVEELAQKLYERVEWPWLMNRKGFISMGYTCDEERISYSWDSYNELAILYILAIGSPTHPISADAWMRLKRPEMKYGEYSFVGILPLFTHQYSHIWINFKNKRDAFMDYFENSILATMANRKWCIDNSDYYKGFKKDCWGLTASDGPRGYAIYGAPNGFCDGTIAPTAALGSFVFTPEYSLSAMKHMYKKYGKKIWGKFGFIDAFNPSEKWFSKMNIGIDQGPILLMIENYRSGMIWKYFMKNKSVRSALRSCGFKSSKSNTNVKTLKNPYADKKKNSKK